MDERREPLLSSRFVARVGRWGLFIWSLIGLLILVGFVYRFALYPIRIIFPPLFVALVVVYLLSPVVDRLDRRGVPRVLATFIVYAFGLSVVGVAIAHLSGVIAHQVGQFVGRVPELLQTAQDGLNAAAQRLGVRVDANALTQAFQPGRGAAFNFFGRLTSLTSNVVHIAFVLVLGPLLAFYLLVDLPKIQRGAKALVPETRRTEAEQIVNRVGATLGGFFRGQLVVALLVGLASMGGFYVVGLPYFALLGAVTGLVALVPLIWIVIAAVPVLFVALTSGGATGGLLHLRGGWPLALASIVVLVAVHQLDLRLLSPRLMSRSSRMHPVSVLLSLLVGGTLLGAWGMVIAVPIVASIKAVVLFVWDTRSSWPPDLIVPTEAAELPGGTPRVPAPAAPDDGARERPAASPAAPEPAEAPLH